MIEDGSAALDALFWRDEILQAMYWLRGEGLAECVEPARLAELLVADEAIVRTQLDRLVIGGDLEIQPDSPPRYRMTAAGREHGARSFSDEFEGLTRQAHGECGPGCYCQDPEREGEPCPNREPIREPEPTGV
jgi:hypothetical protein